MRGVAIAETHERPVSFAIPRHERSSPAEGCASPAVGWACQSPQTDSPRR
jgi:hypothetical protein